MKKLYYVVTVELDDESVSGIKYVNVYNITDNVPVHLFELEIILDYSSEEAIQKYLNDNGYGDETFELIEL